MEARRAQPGLLFGVNSGEFFHNRVINTIATTHGNRGFGVILCAFYDIFFEAHSDKLSDEGGSEGKRKEVLDRGFDAKHGCCAFREEAAGPPCNVVNNGILLAADVSVFEKFVS